MPFAKGQNGGSDGRPKKSAIWKDAEDEIREGLPRLLRMTESLAEKAMSRENDPTLALKLCYTYIKKFPCQAIERFLPNAWMNDPKESKEIADFLAAKLVGLGKPKSISNGHASA